jgi:transmembrane sensor
MEFRAGHDPAHLADEAAMWLAQHDLGTADELAFERWRGQSSQHALAFARAWAAWEATGRLRFEEHHDALASPEPEGVPGLHFSRRTVLRTAAASGAIAILGSGVWSTRAFAWTEARTALGESKRVPLPDGSIATLNTDSVIAWRFNHWERRIRLNQGEVALAVRSGPARFSLQHSQISADLSAGNFNARLDDGDFAVLVFSGSARLRSSVEPGEIVATEQHELIVGNQSARVQDAPHAKLQRAAAWRTGELVFNDDTLASAVRDYNRYLSVKIVIIDPRIANIRVGGRFVSRDPAMFLKALKTTLEVNVLSSPEGYLLSGRND